MENKIEKDEVKQLAIYDISKPTQIVQMAKSLKGMVIKQNLYVNIKGRNYCMVEGWQLAGFMAGMSVIVDEPKNLSTEKEVKYACTAKVYQGEKLVSVGYAVCSNKEMIKKSFDEYAILSMAQTRAIGKAFRNKIGWIMKLAGYEPTPSEEAISMGKTENAVPTESIDKAKAQLKSAKNIKQLQETWKGLTAKQRADDEIEGLKNELKAKLAKNEK